MYKVIEAANYLNVSKVTIYKKMEAYKSELKGHIKKQKGITFIDDEGVEIIKQSLIETGVFRESNEPSQEIVYGLEEQVENLKTFGIYIEDQLSQSIMSNLKDLEIITDFLDNQITIKKSMLAQKDEQLKQYKELNFNNKERIKSLEDLLHKVSSLK